MKKDSKRNSPSPTKYEGTKSNLSKGGGGKSPLKERIEDMDQSELNEIYEQVMDMSNLTKLGGFGKHEVKDLLETAHERRNAYKA